ncbi:MAG: 50S ribosomal protein L32 [Bdellovibrionales bacterium]|nr:50S ribosomal protein L32 [Bdellovibrionales bacterium]
MPVPKRKKSKSKRDMRRGHHALSPSNTHACPQCGEFVKYHHVCASCGFYMDKEVVEVPLEV